MDDRSTPKRPALKTRRGFLLGASAAGVAGAAASAVAASQAALPAAAPGVSEDAARAGGYQVSEHVRHYYRTTEI
jgi:hypothetical protein